MTRNQHRAVMLARHVSNGLHDPADLTDGDWNLLLLAADLNNATSLPMLVCARVLNQAERGVGYFSGPDRVGTLDAPSATGRLNVYGPVPRFAARGAAARSA